MSSPRASLSYGARREVLAQIAPRYRQATNAQKTLMLDQIVKLTGYARKYVIQLLNHVPESAPRILRPRPPFYGSAVQEALFLAWRTIQYPWAQRLVPCLPTLIPVLERDEHLHLDEGSGSLEQDGSISIVAMKEKKQTRLMHHDRLGKRERHADKTSEALAQRILPAFHMGSLSCLFPHSVVLVLGDHCRI